MWVLELVGGKGQARFRKKMKRERNSGHNVRDHWEGNQRASKGLRQYVALMTDEISFMSSVRKRSRFFLGLELS